MYALQATRAAQCYADDEAYQPALTLPSATPDSPVSFAESTLVHRMLHGADIMGALHLITQVVSKLRYRVRVRPPHFGLLLHQ